MSNNLAIDHRPKHTPPSEHEDAVLAEYQQTIKTVYNRTARAYNIERLQLRSQRFLTKFMQYLPKQAHVLDLGCGAGEPVDDVLLKQGYLVTGLDFAKQQLALARQSCPRGEFIEQDLATLKPKQYSTDGIVCLYTLFHLPRITHAQWLKTISTYLPAGGPLLISMGDQLFEGWHEFHGEQIWSSHYGPTENRTMLREAGFSIELDEIDRSGREAHHMIIALKS